jgi:hypothetical protein
MIEGAGAHPDHCSRGEVFPLFNETLLMRPEFCDVLPDLVSLRSYRHDARLGVF